MSSLNLERWKSIEEAIRNLSAALEKLEDEATLSLIEQRAATANYAPVTDDAWTDVKNRFDELTRNATDVEVVTVEIWLRIAWRLSS